MEYSFQKIFRPATEMSFLYGTNSVRMSSTSAHREIVKMLRGLLIGVGVLYVLFEPLTQNQLTVALIGIVLGVCTLSIAIRDIRVGMRNWYFFVSLIVVSVIEFFVVGRIYLDSIGF